MTELKYIFFDVGSVLLHRRVDPLELIARHLGVTFEEASAAHLRVWQRPEANRLWVEMRTFRLQQEFGEKTGRWMLQELGRPVTGESVQFIAAAWNKQQYGLEPGAHEVLLYLSRRYRLGIISNAMPSRRVHELVDHGLLDYFDPVVLSAELGVRKPDPRIYETALELAGVSAVQAAFLDDRLEQLLGAQACGFARMFQMGGVGDLPRGIERIERLKELKHLL